MTAPFHAVPQDGVVVGVDVGYSLTRRSSAVCRLAWTADTVGWTIERFRGVEPERAATLRRVVDRPTLVAAFDGPLGAGLRPVGRYRRAEQILTRGVGRLIGKPGASNTPIGARLNAATILCAEVVLALDQVAPACHPQAIHPVALVEAFPTTYLGMMLNAPETMATTRANRSDVYYDALAHSGALDRLLAMLLPGRALRNAFVDVVNHDDRAGLVCALTALGVAAGQYGAVGDAEGWIILPPAAFVQPWAWPLLEGSVIDEGDVGFKPLRC